MKNLNFIKAVGIVSTIVVVLLLIQSFFFAPSVTPESGQQLTQEPEDLDEYLNVPPSDYDPSVGYGDYYATPIIYEVTPFESDTFDVNETTSYILEEPAFIVEIKTPQGLTDFNIWLTQVIYPAESHFELIYLY